MKKKKKILMNEGVTLTQIAEEHGIIFFDTCSLIAYLTKNFSKEGGEKTLLSNIRRVIEGGTEIFLTPKIKEEYLNKRYFEWVTVHGSFEQRRNIIRRKKFVKRLEESGRIFDITLLNDFAPPRFFLNEVLDKLREPDVELLLSALSCAQRTPTALISNDSGVIRAANGFYKGMLGEEEVNITCYRRVGITDFKKGEDRLPKGYFTTR
ncbi:MAG: hypothetical protein KKF68_03635 [Nanoarchaeota archaeon]|nr:hypothetical protein [Nanoarchaeota archaeon]